MEEKFNPMKIKTCDPTTISRCLYAVVGGNHVHLGTSTPIGDIVCWIGKRTLVHWGVLPVERKCEPWLIALDVMSPSGYVRRHLLNKYIFHLWYFQEYLWMHINKDQLGSLWR